MMNKYKYITDYPASIKVEITNPSEVYPPFFPYSFLAFLSSALSMMFCTPALTFTYLLLLGASKL
jgi:hypothetical protein